jgi:hypothetical protein
MKIRAFLRMNRPTLIVVGFSVVTALVLTLVPVQTTFNITGRSEFLKLVNTSGRWLPLHLTEAILVAPPQIPSARFSGRLSIAPEAEVFIERISLGPIRISCRLPDPGSTAAEFMPDHNPSSALRLSGRFVVLVDDVPERSAKGESVIIPLTGNITIGKNVVEGIASSGLLREGRVDIIGHSLLGKSRFDAGSTNLDMGDVVSLRGAMFSGLLVANEQPALGTSFRAAGYRLKVDRYGAEGYELSTPFPSRFTHDKAFQVLWGTCLAFISFVSFFKKKEKP